MVLQPRHVRVGGRDVIKAGEIVLLHLGVIATREHDVESDVDHDVQDVRDDELLALGHHSRAHAPLNHEW